MTSLAVTAIGVWAGVAALYSSIRGLHVRTRVVRIQDQSVVEAERNKWPGAAPHRMVLTLTLRGRSAINPTDFDQNVGLIFDVGAPILKVLEVHVEPEDAAKPAARPDPRGLRVAPTPINIGTRISFELITAYRPMPVRCQTAIANVRIRGLAGDDRYQSWRPYRMPLLGAATILIELGLPHIVPRLVGMMAYYVASIVLCVVVLVIIGASAGRLARRTRDQGI